MTQRQKRHAAHSTASFGKWPSLFPTNRLFVVFPRYYINFCVKTAKDLEKPMKMVYNIE
jgi:hypothetical protein